MEMLKKEVSKIVQTQYTIQLEDGSVVFRKEMTDENGRVVDSFTRSKDGEYLDTVDEAALMEEIDEFIDSLTEE